MTGNRESRLSGGVCIALLAAIHVLIYRDYWSGSVIFTGKDTFTAYMPLINYQTDCLKAGSLPAWNPFMNFGFPYVEHVLNSVFFPTHLLLALTDSSMFIYQRELLFWIFLGGLGTYLCVRELGHSRAAGLVAGASFMFSGQLVVLPTWSIILYNACCFPYWILGYHRAKRKGEALSLLSVIFLAMPVYSGYVSSYVHGVYYFACYVMIDALLCRKPLFGIKYLAVCMPAAVLLALPKLLPVYLSMGQYERMSVAEVRANPSEIISWYHLMSILIPVKYYFSVYMGELNIIAFFHALYRRALRLNALIIMFIISAWLLIVGSDGSFSLIHRVANAILPMMKLTRNEWMYWNYPLTFGILYLSHYVDIFLADAATRAKTAAVLLFGAALSTAFFCAYSIQDHYPAYITHAVLAALFLAAGFLYRMKKVQIVLLAVLLAAEFGFTFDRTAVDRPVQREGDRIGVMLTHQVLASMSFKDAELVHQTMPMVVLDDRVRPTVSDSRSMPLLRSGFDGNFVDNMNQKRFTGWWYNTQERADFAKLKDTTLGTMDNAPLYGYVDRSSGVSLPAAVNFDGISCSSFDFTVNAGSPGLFVLNQMFDDRWQLAVDGAEGKPLRANQYFMGVELGPGTHRVNFKFRDRVFEGCCAISGLTLSALLITVFIKARKRRQCRA